MVNYFSTIKAGNHSTNEAKMVNDPESKCVICGKENYARAYSHCLCSEHYDKLETFTENAFRTQLECEKVIFKRQQKQKLKESQKPDQSQVICDSVEECNVFSVKNCPHSTKHETMVSCLGECEGQDGAVKGAKCVSVEKARIHPGNIEVTITTLDKAKEIEAKLRKAYDNYGFENSIEGSKCITAEEIGITPKKITQALSPNPWHTGMVEVDKTDIIKRIDRFDFMKYFMDFLGKFNRC